MRPSLPGCRRNALPVSLLLAAAIALPTLGAASPPRPIGKLVDIGGRKLHLVCEGAGNPTVILESGAGGFSFDWALALPLIAKVTRVCAYDRAGYAWSDSSPAFEQFPAAAADLRELMRSAGIRPPWILAGHALGALYARDFQRRFPQDVAGLVLVDPTPEEDTQVVMFGNAVSLIDMADHDLKAWPVRPFAPSLTSPPPRRPAAGGGPEAPFDRLPQPLREARRWALGRLLDELDGLGEQQAWQVMESQRVAFTALYNARHNPATSPLRLPTVALSRGRDTTPKIAAMQEELGRLSAGEIHTVVPGSGPEIQIERPDAVASAIVQVVRAVRAGRPVNGEPPRAAKP
jgi:pimeloyl-ACP methyl ester carboxylesterase